MAEALTVDERTHCVHLSSANTMGSLTVGTHVALVLRAVDLDHLVVDGLLVCGVHPDHSRAKDIIDIRHCLEHTLSEVSIASIAQFTSLVGTRRGSRWHRCDEFTILGAQLNLREFN